MNDQNASHQQEPILSPHASGQPHDRTQPRRGNFFAVLLILIGVVALINQLFPHEWIRWSIFWPVVIILIGVRMIMRGR